MKKTMIFALTLVLLLSLAIPCFAADYPPEFAGFEKIANALSNSPNFNVDPETGIASVKGQNTENSTPTAPIQIGLLSMKRLRLADVPVTVAINDSIGEPSVKFIVPAESIDKMFRPLVLTVVPPTVKLTDGQTEKFGGEDNIIFLNMKQKSYFGSFIDKDAPITIQVKLTKTMNKNIENEGKVVVAKVGMFPNEKISFTTIKKVEVKDGWVSFTVNRGGQFCIYVKN